MKHTKSVYKLQAESDTDTLNSDERITLPHPIYEDMIVQILENQVSKVGMSQELLLKRIKQKWKVKTRYAQPAIRNALKELRKKKRVNRTVEGLYRNMMAKKRPKSGKRVTKKTTKTQTKNTKNLLNLENTNLVKELDNIPIARHATFGRPPGLPKNPVQCCSSKQQSKIDSSSEESELNAGYQMDKNWPLYAETARADLAQMKNRIRQVLLDCAEESMYETEICCQIVGELSQERGVKISAKLQREIAPEVERALLHMISTGETLKCSKNKFSIPPKNSPILLSGRNMRKLLEKYTNSNLPNSSLLLESVKHFKSYSFEEVSDVFDSTIDCMQEPTDFSEDADEIVDYEQTQKSPQTGSRYQQQLDQNKNTESSMTTEQLRLECPCCNNELLITVKYSK